MKHLKLLSSLVVIALLITACATAATPPAPAATTAPTTAATSMPAATTAATTAPTTAPTAAATPTSKPAGNQAPPALSGTSTTVTLAGWVSSPAETALLESLIYEFEQANPGITVKYQPITGNYQQVMETNFASGTAPDVFYVDVSYFQVWASKGVLLPLDPLMGATKTSTSDFVPSLMNAFTFNGKAYGIPKDFNTLGLFYNTALFKKANLALPTDKWTWTDLTNAAKALTNLSDSKNPVYGFCVPSDAGRFPVFVLQNGGTIMTKDFTDTTLDSPQAIQAAQFYTGFRTQKIGAIPADLGQSWQGTDFGMGQCAMVYEGGWLIPYLAQSFPALQYGVARLPAGPAGKGNLLFTVSWSINAQTKVANAAWQVVNFLTSVQSQTTVLQSGFALPSRASLQTSDYLKSNPNVAAIFNGASDNAIPFYWGPAGSDVNTAIGNALDSIYLKNVAPADAMKTAATTIRQAIAALK